LGRVAVIVRDPEPALQGRAGRFEVTRDDLDRTQSAERVSQHDSVASGLGLLGDGACGCRLAGQVAAVASRPGELGGYRKRPIGLASFQVQLLRPVGGGFSGIEVSAGHGQEVAQPKLDDGACRQVRASGEQAVQLVQGARAERVAAGALGFPGQLVEQLAAPRVVAREPIQCVSEQRQRGPVLLPGSCVRGRSPEDIQLLAATLKRPASVLAQGLRHRVAAAAVQFDHRSLDQPRDQWQDISVGDGVAGPDRLCCLERESARQNRQP
jgi:hypothetical protein